MSDLNDTITKAQRKLEQGAKSASQTVSQTARDNPAAVVGAGLAIGAVVGALLPKTKREDELLGPLGKRLAEGATAAAIAARDVGKEELSALKPDGGAAKDKAGSIASHIFDAAKAAALDTSQRR